MSLFVHLCHLKNSHISDIMIFAFDLFHLMCYSIGTNFRAYMFSEFSWTNIFDNSPARLSSSALYWCLALALTTHHDQSTAPQVLFRYTLIFPSQPLTHLTCELFPDVASWVHLYSSLQELECVHFLCLLDYLSAYLIIFLPPPYLGFIMEKNIIVPGSANFIT